MSRPWDAAYRSPGYLMGSVTVRQNQHRDIHILCSECTYPCRDAATAGNDGRDTPICLRDRSRGLEPLGGLRHRGIITGHGSAQRNDLIEAEVPREPLPSTFWRRDVQIHRLSPTDSVRQLAPLGHGPLSDLHAHNLAHPSRA